jgi:hypothetical protein
MTKCQSQCRKIPWNTFKYTIKYTINKFEINSMNVWNIFEIYYKYNEIH